MVPKKAKDLYKELSEDLNVSESLVQDVLEFYYKELKTLMINLEHTRINVHGIGVFAVNHRIVRRSIELTEKMLNGHDESTYKAYHTKKQLEDRLAKTKIIDKKIVEELAKKRKFKAQRNESSTESNLGE